MKPTVVKVTVVVREGELDAVYLHLDLPNPLWPYEGPLCLKFDTPQGTGEDYVRKHFDLTSEVIDTRKNKGEPNAK
jgi:hypothetical protein